MEKSIEKEEEIKKEILSLKKSVEKLQRQVQEMNLMIEFLYNINNISPIR
jgi:hypothetical protein